MRNTLVRRLSVSLDRIELGLNVLLAAACWRAAFLILGLGHDFVAAFGDPPASLPQVWGFLTSPDALSRAAHGAGGCVLVAVGGVLALSAVQGTWWSLRRLVHVL